MASNCFGLIGTISIDWDYAFRQIHSGSGRVDPERNLRMNFDYSISFFTFFSHWAAELMVWRFSCFRCMAFNGFLIVIHGMVMLSVMVYGISQ